MKHLKPYPIYESKILNPIEEYIVPLIDLGFANNTEIDNGGLDRLGVTNLFAKLDNPSDDLLSEIMSEYLSLIDRLKDSYNLNDYSIMFSKGGVSIHIDRDVKNIHDEIEMTPPQLTAYKAVLAALKRGEVLKVNRVGGTAILFDKWKGDHGNGHWIWIYDDGTIELPVLRGRKMNSKTDIPFDERDTKWFKRIIIDNSTLPTREFNTLHNSSQEKLRELYK